MRLNTVIQMIGETGTTFMFFMGKSERLKDDFGLLDILSEFCYTLGKKAKEEGKCQFYRRKPNIF